MQVLGSDPNVFVRSIAPCLDDFDVHKLVAELVKRNAGGNLGPAHCAWTRCIDDPQAAWREDERPRTESRARREGIDEERGG